VALLLSIPGRLTGFLLGAVLVTSCHATPAAPVDHSESDSNAKTYNGGLRVNCISPAQVKLAESIAKHDNFNSVLNVVERAGVRFDIYDREDQVLDKRAVSSSRFPIKIISTVKIDPSPMAGYEKYEMLIVEFSEQNSAPNVKCVRSMSGL